MNIPDAGALPGWRHVVVLDDDPFMLKLLGKMLGGLGLSRTTTTSQGLQALALAVDPEQEVDLVLLDINMPGMDGIEFVRQLAVQGYAGEVVLVSGEGNRMLESVTRLVRSHRLRLLGALQKPPALEALHRLLRGGRGPEGVPALGQRVLPPPSLAELVAAIESGQIVNFYQPQVNLRTDQVVGVEVLARWVRPDGTILGPGEFIPLAEEFGQIELITRRVLRNAARQSRAWQDMGLPLSVAVNVSMQDICALEFPEMLDELLRETGVGPQRFTLEVTESRVLQHLSTVLDVLGRLRLRRFHLAIDDFGTGHSSLAQLRDLPFDELKIDRGFVHGVAANTTQRSICEATVRMATQLGMRTVAEGIEDPRDREVLAELGCELGQGYLIARPQAAEATTQWLLAHAARTGGA